MRIKDTERQFARSSAVPYPGRSFVLRNRDDGCALILLGGRVQLTPEPVPALYSLYNSNSISPPHLRGGLVWDCFDDTTAPTIALKSNTRHSETFDLHSKTTVDVASPPLTQRPLKGYPNGFLGFCNSVSGTVLGWTRKGVIVAEAEVQKGWESFVARQRPGSKGNDGGYELWVMVGGWKMEPIGLDENEKEGNLDKKSVKMKEDVEKRGRGLKVNPERVLVWDFEEVY